MSEVIEHWTYALHYGDTLSSHDWAPLHFNRLLTSRFVARIMAEDRRADGFTALILWCESLRQDPAGTLPDDDLELMRLAGFGADRAAWQAAKDGALYGWRRCHIEGDALVDDVRLGHPFIEGLARDMLKRKRGREQGRSAAAVAVHQSRLRKKLAAMGSKRLADQQAVVTAASEWLRAHDLYMTDENVSAALDAVGAAALRVVK